MVLNYSIEELEKSHLEYCEGFLETLSNLTKVGEIDKNIQEKILSKIKSQNGYVYIAINKNSIIGSLTLLVEQKFIHSGGRIGHIEDVSIRKGYEGNGIGRFLVSRALYDAKKFCCYKIVLSCSDSNMKFYERFGFYVNKNMMRVDL